jgi:hypothetical protein
MRLRCWRLGHGKAGKGDLKRPESVRARAGIGGAPEILAGQVDVLPAGRRKAREQLVRHQIASATHSVEGTAETLKAWPVLAARADRLTPSGTGTCIG